MRFRARGSWAKGLSVLAALLLVCSSLASACELECSLAKARVCCAASSARQTMGAMPGMEPTAGVRVAAEAGRCVHPLCASALVERGAALTQPQAGVERVSMPGVPVVPAATSPASALMRGPPRLAMASPVALHSLARV